MKKLFVMFAAAMLTASASAQNTVITASQAGDNWYVGVNAGASTRIQETYDGAEDGLLKSLAPTFGVRIGKNLTTVFGLALDADMHFKSNEKWLPITGKTIVEDVNVDLLGTFNLSNLFGGYKGEPRFFEVIGLGGFGWSHGFNHQSKANGINSRVALDFAFNLGKAKALQLYVEPSLTYGLISSGEAFENIQYNLKNSWLSAKVGLNYKFNTSNGTHNFAKAQLRDQAEIDGLNAQINSLRSDVDAANAAANAKDRTINDLKNQLAACQARPTQTIVEKKEQTTLQPIVIFGQGKTTIDAAGMASLEMVAKYMKNHKDAKIKVLGFASPEGSKEVNDRIAQARADAAKNVLVKKYKIAADRLVAEGQGATDQLSAENDFNRVAKFVDMTQK